MHENIDRLVEENTLRYHGLLGRGDEMGNMLFAIEYEQLPVEAKHTLGLIMSGGPFPFPNKDGKRFHNRFGDLPGKVIYLEFTVPTPGVKNRGARRIVVRGNGIPFFTACHYERVPGQMPVDKRRSLTAQVDPEWRNGFYVITGLTSDQRSRLSNSIEKMLTNIAITTS